MRTTGDPLVDDLFKSKVSITSNHVITAEFNINSYFIPQYYGTYNTTSMPSTFTVGSGYTSGINQLQFDGVDKDDKKRKKISPLYDCFMPNRPNPGIIKPVAVIGNKSKIISSATDIKQISYANAESRIYPCSENDSFKYWNSYRYVGGVSKGLAGSNKSITDTNPFVVYNDYFYTNKIVIKTQKEKSYVQRFKIQVLQLVSGVDTWVDAVTRTSNSTDFSTGEIVISYSSGSWSVVTSDQDQVPATNLFQSGNTELVKIKGVRLVVTQMSVAYTPLELIEISPRILVDVTQYTMDFSIDKSIGETTFGLPVGSIVSSSGSITLSNDNGAFDRMKDTSIFTYRDNNNETKTMLGQNIKFSMYQTIEESGQEYWIKIGSMYSANIDNSSEYSISISLEDYIKFFREKASPNLLLAFKNSLKASVAIRMLLDNIGFNRLLFYSTTDASGKTVDPTIKFFYCSNSVTVAEVLNDLAKSLQLSIYMDSSNNLCVMTKEKLLEKSTKLYLATSNESNGYLPNIESFNDKVIPPITAANVNYKLIDIKKEYTGILEYRNSEDFKDISEIASTDPGSVLTNYAYVNDIIWQVGKESNDSILLAGVLVKEMSATRPKNIIVSNSPTTYLRQVSFTANNEKDAVRAIFNSFSSDLTKQADLQIFIEQSDLVVFGQASKYSGHLQINDELVKFNGMNYTITTKSTSYDRIIFSSNELEAIKASSGSGATFVPKSLIISLDLKESSGLYTVYDDGRGQEETSVKKHSSSQDKLDTTKWTNFSNLIADKDLNDLGNTKADALLSSKNRNKSNITGYLKLQGPSKLNTSTGKTVSIPYLPINDYGQRFVHGIYQDLGFNPQMIGTKMKLINLDADASKDSSSHTAGIAFCLTDRGETDGKYVEGYYLEVSDDIDATGGKTPDDKTNNIRLYRLAVTQTNVEAFVLGASKVKITPTTYQGFANGVPEDGRVSEFDIKVIITRPKKNRLKFSVYWEGIKLFTIEDKNALAWNSKAGLFVRDDSVAIYDHFYAYARSSQNPVTHEDKDLYTAKSLYDLTNVLKTNEGNVMFESFGNSVREAIKINAKFEAPTLRSTVIDISSVNPLYLVKDYKSSSFGANMWVYNTSDTNVILDESTATPLYVAGLSLDYRADGQISYNDLIMDDVDNEKRKVLNKNKNMYGDVEISIDTEYLNNREDAEKILYWILENSLEEKKEISIQMFPNPLLEVGDKIGVYYPEIGYSESNIGDKTYYISEISRSINESGPVMNISVREC